MDESLEGGYYLGFDVTTLRAKKRDAVIGYMSINVVDPPKGVKWGKVNDRFVDHGWVEKLSKSFALQMNNCTDLTAMDASVKKEWIANLDLKEGSVEGLTILDVREIVFTDAGRKEIRRDNFWMLSGNHRRLAAITLVEGMRENLQHLEEAFKKEQAKESKDGYTYDQDALLRQMSKEIHDLEQKVKMSCLWVVQLYD